MNQPPIICKVLSSREATGLHSIKPDNPEQPDNTAIKGSQFFVVAEDNKMPGYFSVNISDLQFVQE